MLDTHVPSGEPYYGNTLLTNLVVNYDNVLNVVHYHKTVTYCCWRPRAFRNQSLTFNIKVCPCYGTKAGLGFYRGEFVQKPAVIDRGNADRLTPIRQATVCVSLIVKKEA